MYLWMMFHILFADSYIYLFLFIYLFISVTDINECDLGTHKCEQKCVNTPGSNTCDCYTGFKKHDTDPTKCVQDGK